MDNALAVGIRQVVDTNKGIPLGNQREVSAFHSGGKVPESKPVQSVFPVFGISYTHSRNDKLVLFGNVIAVIFGRHTAVLLHNDDIIDPERIVQLSAIGLEVHLPVGSIVMIHLHHTGKDAVVVLAKHLADDKLIDTHGTTHHQVVELGITANLFFSGCVLPFLHSDGPALSSDETRNEFLGRQVTLEYGMVFDQQVVHSGQNSGDKVVGFHVPLFFVVLLGCPTCFRHILGIVGGRDFGRGKATLQTDVVGCLVGLDFGEVAVVKVLQLAFHIFGSGEVIVAHRHVLVTVHTALDVRYGLLRITFPEHQTAYKRDESLHGEVRQPLLGADEPRSGQLTQFPHLVERT